MIVHVTIGAEETSEKLLYNNNCNFCSGYHRSSILKHSGTFSSAQKMVLNQVQRFFLPALQSLLQEKRSSRQVKGTPKDLGICFISDGQGFFEIECTCILPRIQQQDTVFAASNTAVAQSFPV